MPNLPTPPSDIGDFIIGFSPIEGSLLSAKSPGVTKTIPSYLYQHYKDDDVLQAFVASYNSLTQEWVDWFNSINLPVYTGTQIDNYLADWVLGGLYGYPRPVLAAGATQEEGPFNTYALDSIAFDTYERVGPTTYYATTDDIYKRCLTWHYYKGDGKVFNIRWLKRRVMRFLIGANGTAPNIDQTYLISVSFGVGNQVNIRIIETERFVTGGAIFDDFALNTEAFNGYVTEQVHFPLFGLAATLEAAIASGALELPFQFTYVVTAE